MTGRFAWGVIIFLATHINSSASARDSCDCNRCKFISSEISRRFLTKADCILSLFGLLKPSQKTHTRSVSECLSYPSKSDLDSNTADCPISYIDYRWVRLLTVVSFWTFVQMMVIRALRGFPHQGMSHTIHIVLECVLGGSTFLEPPVDSNEFTVKISIIRRRTAQIKPECFAHGHNSCPVTHDWHAM